METGFDCHLAMGIYRTIGAMLTAELTLSGSQKLVCFHTRALPATTSRELPGVVLSHTGFDLKR